MKNNLDEFDEIFSFTRQSISGFWILRPLAFSFCCTAVVLVPLIAASIVGVMPGYSRGERVGVVTKLSYKGMKWKSWEGTLNEGGTRILLRKDGSEGVVPNLMRFNVQDPKVLKALQDAMVTGQRVKITYSEWLIAPVEIDSTYVVVNVDVLD